MQDKFRMAIQNKRYDTNFLGKTTVSEQHLYSLNNKDATFEYFP